MEPKKDVVEKGRSVRDMHHLRLMSLLQELERDNGRKKTAEMLGVDRRTLDASLDEGVLTRRIRGALEKALQSGVGSAAAEQRTATTGWPTVWRTWRAASRSLARR